MQNHSTLSEALKIGGYTVTALVTMLFFLNVFAGLIGGIWLAFLGQWGVLLIGFLYSIAMPFVYSILALPNMGIAFLLMKAVESRNKFFTGLLGLISTLYTYGLFTWWVIIVFAAFVLEAGVTDFIPLLLWGYSTVMAPLSYMASQEGEDDSSGFALLFAQVMYLVVVIIWFFGIPGDVVIYLIAAPAVGVSLITAFILVNSLNQPQSNLMREPEIVDHDAIQKRHNNL